MSDGELKEPSALLPCPFCGTPPVMNEIGNAHTKTRRIVVKCNNCRTEQTNAAMRFGMDWLRAVAIGGWNRRSQPSAPAWVAMNEQKPEPRYAYLVCWAQWPHVRPEIAWFDSGGKFGLCSDDKQPTHWMPLPAAPTQGDKA